MGAEQLPPPFSLESYDIELLSDAVDVAVLPGKGRGLVVSEDCERGALLLCEEATFPLHQDDMGDTLRALLRDVVIPWASGKDASPLAKLLLLSPSSLQSLPEEQMEAARYVEHFCGALAASEVEEATVREAAHAHTDLLKMLAVKVAMNSFPSGVFLYLSMLNHSCCANCEVVNEAGTTHIVTNRAVKAGEELTIRYAAAAELQGRYGFKCACAACVCDHVSSPMHAESAMQARCVAESAPATPNQMCEREKDIAKLMRGRP